MKIKIQIKGMVCQRCVEAVGEILKGLDIHSDSIVLGQAILSNEISDDKKRRLTEALKNRGFELLEDKESTIVAMIKTVIINQIHHSEKSLNVNYSTLLSTELKQPYASLSRLFSGIEGITIERFVVKQKMEKVKELMVYDELTLSEIAYKMSYSSVAHLSSQFKKETGMTPSTFKKLENQIRNPIDLM